MIDTKQYVIKQIEERNIRFLRLWFTDIFGNLKNVAITPSDIEIAFEEGIGFDGSNYGYAQVERSDMVFLPDITTAVVDPICSCTLIRRLSKCCHGARATMAWRACSAICARPTGRRLPATRAMCS